jgi:hypothetical protein
MFRQAEVDDVVFHYDVGQGAITGWSRVSGLPEDLPIVWVARGSYARERGATATDVPGYVVPLADHPQRPPRAAVDTAALPGRLRTS